MKEPQNIEKKFCGNCWYHDTYQYPDLVFCELRFLKHKNPVVSTLHCCEHWKREQESCFCVEDAKNAEEKIAEHCQAKRL